MGVLTALRNRIWMLAACGWILLCLAGGIWLYIDAGPVAELIVVMAVVTVMPVLLVWGVRLSMARFPRSSLAVALVVCAAGAGLWALVELEPFRHKATSFEIPQSCHSSDAGKRVRGDSLKAEWKDDGLVVRASVCDNCAFHVERASAQVIGKFVFVRVRVAKPEHGIRAACDCEHVVVVRLAGLPKRDYKVMRIGSPWTEPTSCI